MKFIQPKRGDRYVRIIGVRLIIIHPDGVIAIKATVSTHIYWKEQEGRICFRNILIIYIWPLRKIGHLGFMHTDEALINVPLNRIHLVISFHIIVAVFT